MFEIGSQGVGLRRNMLHPELYSPFWAYLEVQGDLVSRPITPMTHIVTLVFEIINPLTKSP